MTWKRVRLRDVGTWYGGGTPSKAEPSFWTGGDVPWLSPKDMGPEVLQSTINHVTDSAVTGSSTKLVPSGSVAIVTRSGILERTFPVALVPFETTMNQDMKAVCPREDIDARWIAWGLRSYESELLRTTRKAGTTVASIEMPRFYDVELPLPELDEQRHIVAVLEDQLSRLDAAVKSVNAASARSRIMLERAMSRYFSEAEGKATTLGAIAQWGSGGTPSVRTLSYYEGGSIPWLNSGDLKDTEIHDAPKKITELGLAESSAKWVPEGSVLVAMYGATIGKTGITRASVTTNQAIAFATPHHGISARWLQWYIRSQYSSLRAAGKGGAQPNISQAILKAWPVTVPSPETQLAQVRACEQIDSQGHALRSAISASNRRSKALRRSLLEAAFAGRLTRPGTVTPL